MLRMNLTLIVVVALVSVGYVAAVCRHPPSLWCSSGEIAKQCGVYEECRQSLRKDTDAGPVNLTLYFESLCPDCKRFFTTQLTKTWTLLGEDVLNLTLVPYGNARESQSEGKWVFECQHGKQECIGNLIETCAIAVLKDIKEYFPLISCIEAKNGMPEKDAEECAAQYKIDLQPIIECANSDMGNKLEHQMALQTNALQPPHRYVPWVTVNGVHTEKMERMAEEDLLRLICETYKGPTPKACEKMFSKDEYQRCYRD